MSTEQRAAAAGIARIGRLFAAAIVLAAAAMAAEERAATMSTARVARVGSRSRRGLGRTAIGRLTASAMAE
jgi:hypothetical protein